jgi:hypothetical protein
MLGLTSTAAATNVDKVIQLSVDGEIVDEVTINLSQIITLDIVLADGYAMDVMELDLEVIPLSAGADGCISFDPVIIHPWEIIVAPFEPWSLIVEGVTCHGIEIIAGMTFGSVEAKLVDYILFECLGEGDILIQLTDAGTNNIIGIGDIPQEMMGSIIIHQVPEPTTIFLLGLGSLFMLRRRR